MINMSHMVRKLCCFRFPKCRARIVSLSSYRFLKMALHTYNPKTKQYLDNSWEYSRKHRTHSLRSLKETRGKPNSRASVNICHTDSFYYEENKRKTPIQLSSSGKRNFLTFSTEKSKQNSGIQSGPSAVVNLTGSKISYVSSHFAL